MKPLSRMDTAPNIDIERPGKVDDEAAARGHMAAKAADAAMKAIMRADAEKPKEEEGESKKLDEDSPGVKIDKILEALDSIGKRFDSISSRMDALESKDGAEAAAVLDKKRKDGLIATKRGGEEMGEEEGEPRPLKADKKDSYNDSDANRDELATIQTRADHVCSAWGTEVRKPFLNEPAHSYRRRVIEPLKQHSDSWKSCDLKQLGPDALKVAADQIFADAVAALDNNATFEGTGNLYPIRKVDPLTGHRITEWRGNPMSWMSQFTGGRRLAKFNMDLIKGKR